MLVWKMERKQMKKKNEKEKKIEMKKKWRKKLCVESYIVGKFWCEGVWKSYHMIYILWCLVLLWSVHVCASLCGCPSSLGTVEACQGYGSANFDDVLWVQILTMTLHFIQIAHTSGVIECTLYLYIPWGSIILDAFFSLTATLFIAPVIRCYSWLLCSLNPGMC